MKRTLLAVFLVVVLVVSPMPASAAQDPRFETYVPEPTLQPGQTTQLTVQLQNDAADHDDRVDPAYDVHATMQSGETPFTINSGVRLLGTLNDGALTSTTFSVSVPRDIEAGTYRIPIELEYRPAGENERTTKTVYATVRIRDRARFEVVQTTSDAQVGDTGTVNLELKNVGSANASAATVTLQSQSGDVTFGKSASATRYVGSVGINETVTVSYQASVASGAEVRPYALTATVAYDDEDGAQRQSAPLSIGMTPIEAQSFTLSNVESTLRVGEEGELTVTVTNEGPQPVSDAVVELSRPGMNIEPLETEIAVGTLDAGASATVSFLAEVSSSAEPGPKQFRLYVDYQNREDEARQSDGLLTRVEVAAERDRFGLEPISATLESGEAGELVLAVTNNGDDPVRNVNAKLFADDPIAASDDEAFITELDPGETTEIRFGVSAAPGALEKAYPVSMDFQYDVGGETKLSKTYTVAVDVTKPADSGGLPIPYIVGGVIVVLAVAGYVLYQRR